MNEIRKLLVSHYKLFMIITAIILTASCIGLRAAEEVSLHAVATDTSQIEKLTTEELHTLLAPIALYPDALLAQLLPASTFPIQVVEAYRYTQTATTPDTPPANTTWDSSVIALLHYPPVLKKLNDDLTWMEQLGVAVTFQMADVTQAIQQVRGEAQAAGNLVSNDKQNVVADREIIQIVPSNPQVIYVPTYDPIYISEPYYVGRPFYSWGSGFGYGLWLGCDFDWWNHRIWRRNSWYGGGWNRWRNPGPWRPPVRPIPGWYQRHGGGGLGLLGSQRIDPLRSNFPRPDRVHPNRNANSSAIRPPVTTKPAVKNPPKYSFDGEGLNNRGHQTIKESQRGQNSRGTIIRPDAAPRPAPVRPIPHATPSRPSIRQEIQHYTDRPSVQRQSDRGAASRGSVQRRR